LLTTRAGLAVARVKRPGDGVARHLKSGSESGEEARRDRGGGEGEHPGIQAHFGESRNAGDFDGSDDGQGEVCAADSENSAECVEEQRLDHDVADEAGPACSERSADSDFAAPRDATGEQKTRDFETGDGEEEGDGSEEGPERAAVTSVAIQLEEGSILNPMP
jgi:hypothetical protein